MERTLFAEEHDILRDAFRKWLAAEVVPHHPQWEKDGIVPREVWQSAGESGFLCPQVQERFGGSGADYLYNVVIDEELARARASGLAIPLHNDICVPYLESFGSEEQKERWLPGCVSGEKITAIAMTEPNTGSDLQAVRTTAIKDGDNYVVNGQKTFISNGILGDLVIVVAKTDTEADPAYAGISLIVVERDTPGFERGRNLEKMGMHAQDTAEMSFTDCVVPKENLLGEEGHGFMYLMQKLQQERLVVAVGAQTAAEAVLEDCLAYVNERTAFGRPIGKFQNTQFALAEVATEVEIGRTFVDRLIQDHIKGEQVVKEVSMAKYWITEMLNRTVDRCLQFYGGYGFMSEYQISKDYVDARVQSLYAGTNEIMKLIISRQIGL